MSENIDFPAREEKKEEVVLEVDGNSENVKEVRSDLAEDESEYKEDKVLTKLDILKKLSPGTGFREGLNDIVNGNKGALIVVGDFKNLDLFEGGFQVNCQFTSKRLAELAKMDGAIILSDDFRKILYANTLLIPDRSFSTTETGTRHQTAERIAKQSNGLVIAVSERRGTITAYYGNSRYVLQNTSELLRRATETLQILEKQREVFDDLLTNFNVLEITNLVSVSDVCGVLQRLEMIKKMVNIINEYIIELGREGIIVRMRMRELTKGIERNQNLIIKDYFSSPSKVVEFLEDISFDGLLDIEAVAGALFSQSIDTKVVAKGYRILSKTDLNDSQIEALVGSFNNLDGIMEAENVSLEKVLQNYTDSFMKEFNTLKEQIMMGKRFD